MKHVSSKISIIILLLFVIQSHGQQLEELKKKYEKEIIGTWESDDELGHKLEFTLNGRLKIYSENELVGSMDYAVAISCNGNTMSDGRIYLKLDENGDIGCDTLEAVNRNNSNILSITTEQGKLELYTKVN